MAMDSALVKLKTDGIPKDSYSDPNGQWKLSVVIITLNEEKNIARCIDSVLPVADEILVLDSFSTDQTVAIAESRGATVFQEKFLGHIQQKNRGLQLTKYHLVLSLDADEALDDILLNSIQFVKRNIAGKAFTMNRCTNYCGKFIRHGLWYPDTKLRLFDKRQVHWGGANPHDKVIPDKALQIVHLKGDILHYSYNYIEEHTVQNNYFSSIAANAMYELGKPFRFWNVILNPFWAFINGYILRAGFLDGVNGFFIAINTAHYTFLKYSKLYYLSKQPAVSATVAGSHVTKLYREPMKKPNPA